MKTVIGLIFSLSIPVAAAPKVQPRSIRESCNRLLKVSFKSPTLMFMTMFADHRPVTVDNRLISAENGRDQIEHFMKVSGRHGELAFLIKNDVQSQSGGPFEILIGHPGEKAGSCAPTMTVTQTDGTAFDVPIENILAYTLLDTRNRDALFDREFPVAYLGPENEIEKDWRDSSYIQKIFFRARNERPARPETQKAIDLYRAWLDVLAKRKERLAVLVREPYREGQELVIGVVKPLLEQVNGYNAITGVEIQTSAGEHFRVPISLNSYTVGVLKMTNDSYVNLTSKRGSYLKLEFNRIPIHHN